MRTERFGELTVHLAGGTDRDGGGDGPLVTLLHGYGAPGTDLVGIARQLSVPRQVRFAFPEAPLTLDLGYGIQGRGWWEIDMEELNRVMTTGDFDAWSRHVPAGLSQARNALTTCLDELSEKLAVPTDGLILGGFSQGAMVSLDLALREHERPLRRLVLMSGTLICRDEWTPLLPLRKGLPVLQSHGRSDPILPFSLAEELHDLLKRAGVDAEMIRFNGGHGVADSVLMALQNDLQD